MSFQTQPGGKLLGCGPDRHYDGREDAEKHWADIRATIAAGTPIVERHPPLTLKQQAEKQIAILERDLAEWREIERKATS